jgi:uncharacterized protein (DUF2249 family)
MFPDTRERSLALTALRRALEQKDAMNKLTDAIRTHHRSLAGTLSAHARGVGADEQSERRAFVAFLKGDVLPHARSEERHLYPMVDPLVRQQGKPTATMEIDHEFIASYISRIEQAAHELENSRDTDRAQLLGRLRDLASRLDAIFELHLAKEERVYLPLIEAHVDETEQRRVYEAIHADYAEGKTATSDRSLAVRDSAPRDRHTLIFQSFEGLKPGEAFVLINDHDPKPLYYQFEAEHRNQFSWSYLEEGPEVWRVRIGRRAG